MMDLSGIPVLVIDDDRTTRDLNIRILKRLGFSQVFETADGTEALDCLAASAVAFVLCDLHMRPMDGLTFVLTLRQSDNPLLRGLPVIMVTSEMRQEAIDVSEKLKVAAYVVKPTSALELKAAIGKALAMDPADLFLGVA
jgi:two-component system chemotaxis response regulator CheY